MFRFNYHKYLNIHYLTIIKFIFILILQTVKHIGALYEQPRLNPINSK